MQEVGCSLLVAACGGKTQPLPRTNPMHALDARIGGAECTIIQEWITRHIPERSNFKLALSAKYLGFHLGPKSGAIQWTAAVRKWQERAKDIASSHMGALLASLTYNSRAIAVLGYITQLVPPST